MKLPPFLKIGSHKFKVIRTDDTKYLDGDCYGHWDNQRLEIHIKKSIPNSLIEETILHEIGEILMRTHLHINSEDIKHQDWSRLSDAIYACLINNKINFEGQK